MVVTRAQDATVNRIKGSPCHEEQSNQVLEPVAWPPSFTKQSLLATLAQQVEILATTVQGL